MIHPSIHHGWLMRALTTLLTRMAWYWNTMEPCGPSCITTSITHLMASAVPVTESISRVWRRTTDSTAATRSSKGYRLPAYLWHHIMGGSNSYSRIRRSRSRRSNVRGIRRRSSHVRRSMISSSGNRVRRSRMMMTAMTTTASVHIVSSGLMTHLW